MSKRQRKIHRLKTWPAYFAVGDAIGLRRVVQEKEPTDE